MKILVDMNLSPDWVNVLSQHNVQSVHWKDIGESNAADIELINWAKDHNYIIFTHDLDFGSLLRLTQAEGPSVIQVRTQDVTVSNQGDMIISVLNDYRSFLEKGALLTLDEEKLRMRILPLK